ncbi:ATP-binding protein [Streptomyces cacaoi]|uniref:ATP-binding protein n=1 Tax=Streptomyces cacaoi TaxID=1898 RepID=UPI001659EF30|nr:ATP-binding protein [Streptomyces cacaoi]
MRPEHAPLTAPTPPTDPQTGRHRTKRLAASPASARAARDWIRTCLAEWHVTGEDSAQLIVSELVTNAVVHASGEGIDIVAVLDSSCVTVYVTDTGCPTAPQRAPVCRPLSQDEETGRGLQLVATLASHWGSRRVGRGVTVWARLPVEADR